MSRNTGLEIFLINIKIESNIVDINIDDLFSDILMHSNKTKSYIFHTAFCL